MADVKHYITKGIGLTGGVPFFIRFGLDAYTPESQLSLKTRTTDLTVQNRNTELSVLNRITTLTLRDR